MQSSNWMFSLDCGREMCLPLSIFNNLESRKCGKLFRICLASGLNEQCVLYNKTLQCLQNFTKHSKNCLKKKKSPYKKASVSWKKECVCTSRFPSIYFQWTAFFVNRIGTFKTIIRDKINFLINLYVVVHIYTFLFLGLFKKSLLDDPFQLSSCLVMNQFYLANILLTSVASCKQSPYF